MARASWNEEDTYKVQDQTSWGGFAGRAPSEGNPGGLANGATRDINRYRGMGQQAAQRGAYQIDYSSAAADRQRAEAARYDQQDAMGMARAAAQGTAPSRAELLGQRMVGDSLDAQMAAAASARGGPLAQAGAMNAAAAQAAQQQQRGVNDIAALRADEMARAREAYAGQAAGIRQQDYAGAQQAAQMAQAQAQSEWQQRQMNQQAQMGYEQMGNDVNRAQQQGALERYRIDADVAERTNQRNYERQQKSDDRWFSAIGSAVGGVAGFLSDGRTKDVMPSGVMGYEDGARIGADGLGYVERPESRSVVPEKYRAMQAHSEAAAGGDDGGSRRGKRGGSKAGGVDLDKAAAELERSTRQEWGARLAQGPAIRRVAEGTPENGYTTQLTEGGEQAFQRWHQRTAPWDSGHDYDLRGAFADGIDRDGRGHLPDTYKKPNHETFSDESTYAKHAPDEAGSWDGERYKPKGPPAWLRQEVRGRDPMAEANRAMDPEVYRYKPGTGEDPSAVHVGPIAQRMAADPVASTAIRRLPDGTLAVDGAGADRLALAGNAANQRQIDELRAEIARLQRGR